MLTFYIVKFFKVCFAPVDFWIRPIEKLKRKTENNTKNIEIVFRPFNELSEEKGNSKPRKQISFKINNPAHRKKETSFFAMTILKLNHAGRVVQAACITACFFNGE